MVTDSRVGVLRRWTSKCIGRRCCCCWPGRCPPKENKQTKKKKKKKEEKAKFATCRESFCCLFVCLFFCPSKTFTLQHGRQLNYFTYLQEYIWSKSTAAVSQLRVAIKTGASLKFTSDLHLSTPASNKSFIILMFPVSVAVAFVDRGLGAGIIFFWKKKKKNIMKKNKKRNENKKKNKKDHTKMGWYCANQFEAVWGQTDQVHQGQDRFCWKAENEFFFIFFF